MEKFDIVIRKITSEDPEKDILLMSRTMLTEELNNYLKKYNMAETEEGLPYRIQESDIERKEKGKPYIEMGPFAFSVSHTGCYWGIMIGPENCGFDIQEDRDVNLKKLMNRYFRSSDYRTTEEEEISDNEFRQIWTRREAYAKYTGAGFFGSETISPYDKDNVAFKNFIPIEGMTACVCTQEPCEIEVVIK